MVWSTDIHTYEYLCWCMCTFCAGIKASMHGGVCACMCVQVYLQGCMLVYALMFVCTYVYVQVCMQMCILVCILVCMHRLVCVHMNASLQARVGVCMCLWIIRDLTSRFSTYSYTHSGQWTTFWDQFSTTTMWVCEVNLRSSGSVAAALTN